MGITATGQGFSESSKKKREDFQSFLKVNKSIVDHILNRQENLTYPDYIYVDLNSGTGLTEDGSLGSALTFLQTTEPKRYLAYLVEKSNKAYNLLEKNIFSRNLGFSGDLIPFHGDNKEYLYHIRRDLEIKFECVEATKGYGLVYSDENGTDIPFRELTDFYSYSHTKNLDLLIYVSATNFKRVMKALPNKGSSKLSDRMNQINKLHWHIRQPKGQEQWCFLFGTNWLHYPELKKQGFYRTDTKQGQAIMQRINHTVSELNLMDKLEYENKYNQLSLKLWA